MNVKILIAIYDYILLLYKIFKINLKKLMKF